MTKQERKAVYDFHHWLESVQATRGEMIKAYPEYRREYVAQIEILGSALYVFEELFEEVTGESAK